MGYGIPSRRARREKRRTAGRVCLPLTRRYNTLDLAGKVSVPRGCGPFGNPGDEGRWAASLPVLQAGARDAFWCRRSSAMREMIQERGAHAHQRASAAKAAIHIVGIGFILLDAMDGRSRECDRVQHLKKIAGLHRYRCRLLPEDGVSFRLSPVGDWLRQAWTARQAHCGYNDRQKRPCPGENPDRAVLCNVMVKAVAPPALLAPAAGQAAPSPPWVWDAPGRRLAPAAAALP